MTISIEVEVDVVANWVDACRHEAARELRDAADRLEHHEGYGVAERVTAATDWIDRAETLMNAWENVNPDDTDERGNAEAVSSGTEATNPTRRSTPNLGVDEQGSR